MRTFRAPIATVVPAAVVLVAALAPAPRAAAAGIAGGALLFNGSTQYTRTPDSPSLRLGAAATLEAWVLPQKVGPFAPGQGARLIAKGDGQTVTSNRAYEMEISTPADPTGGVANYFTGAANGWTEADGPAGFAVGQWTHLASTYDAANGVARLYVNGALAATRTVTTTNDPITRSLYPSTYDLVLGSWNGLGQFFQGQMDEVRIWNVARTPAEIAASYNRTVAANAAGLVAYYNFDEAAGDQRILDRTALHNDGVLGNTAAAAADDPTRVDSSAPLVAPEPAALGLVAPALLLALRRTARR